MREHQALLGTAVALGMVLLLLMACGGSSPSYTPPAGSSTTVTLAEDGQTITLRVGSSLLLKLGEDYGWTVAVDDQAIVSRVKNIAVGTWALHTGSWSVRVADTVDFGDDVPEILINYARLLNR
jgi:hypothetical protein